MLFAFLCTSVYAKKPDVKSEIAETTISGYVQVQYQTTNDDDAESQSTFNISHGCLQIESELTKSLSSMIEIDALTDYVDAKDVYLKYKITPMFSLKAGQMKKPFSFAKLESPRESIMIECPFYDMDEFDDYLGRDIGVIAKLDIRKQFDISAGMFNGAGSGADAVIDDDNTKDFAGRVEYKPIKLLELAFNVSSHGLTKDDVSKRKNAYGADISINQAGFRMIAEGLFGDKLKFSNDAQMLAFYVTTAYKHEFGQKIPTIKSCEVGGRFEYIDSDRTVDNDAVTSITPYFGIYFDQNACLKMCPTIHFPKQGDKTIEFIMQMQSEF